MTNYNDGEWHIWNGGKCPVHPKTRVKIQMANESRVMTDGNSGREAGDLDWRGRDMLPTSAVTAFCVVKEYREPREFLIGIREDGSVQALESEEYALKNGCPKVGETDVSGGTVIRVREVIE